MPISEQLLNQLSESIKLVFDLTSRIDERVKHLSQQNVDFSVHIKNFIDKHQDINTRICVLESKDYAMMKREIEDMGQKLAIIESRNINKRLEDVEGKMEQMNFFKTTTEGKVKIFVDIFWKLLVGVLTCYIAFKLGVNN